MYKCDTFYKLLKKNNINFFTGIPDSLLKNFCAFLTDNINNNSHIIAANEGSAVALAAGHYLSTSNIGLVYMQNSGQGNAINPLVSLADPLVYGIPMLLLVGWRGEPGVKDEPQHAKQGIITKELFETLGIQYKVVTEKSIEDNLKEMCEHSLKNTCPVALLVRKNFFEPNITRKPANHATGMSRERSIQIICENLPSDKFAFVSTTGMISRELFEIRQSKKRLYNDDFLVVGSMGTCFPNSYGNCTE